MDVSLQIGSSVIHMTTYLLASIIQQPRWTVAHVGKGNYRRALMTGSFVKLQGKPVWTTTLFAVYRSPKARGSLIFSRCAPIQNYTSWCENLQPFLALFISGSYVIS